MQNVMKELMTKGARRHFQKKVIDDKLYTLEKAKRTSGYTINNYVYCSRTRLDILLKKDR